MFDDDFEDVFGNDVSLTLDSPILATAAVGLMALGAATIVVGLSKVVQLVAR